VRLHDGRKVRRYIHRMSRENALRTDRHSFDSPEGAKTLFS
jgi:hypothetical protein